MASFTFRLDSFSISETMAKHLDTDWVYFSLKIGDQVHGPTHAKIGDLNNGNYPLGWELGPVEVAPQTLVVMTYQIVNHGHDDSSKQAADDINIATQITAGLAGVTAAAVPPAAVVLGIIAGALSAVGSLAEWLLGDGPNCDGLVLSDALTTNGAGLLALTQPSGVHSETRSYTGPETPHGCGPDARYTVGWSILESKPRTQPIKTEPVKMEPMKTEQAKA